MYSRNRKESLIEFGNGDAAFRPQGNAGVDPVAHAFHPSQRRSAWAPAWRDSRHVAGPVANQWHASAAQRSEHHFTQLPIVERVPSGSRDDLKMQVSLAQMVAGMHMAIHTAPEAHLSGTIVLEDVATG